MILTSVLVLALGAANPTDVRLRDAARPAEPSASLRGLSGVEVVVEEVQQEARQLGLDPVQIREEATARLRKAGIRVLDDKEVVRTPGMPSLFLDVLIYSNLRQQGVFFNINIDLLQKATLVRDPKIAVVVQTWHQASVGIVDRSQVAGLKSRVLAHVDRFISAYQLSNPK